MTRRAAASRRPRERADAGRSRRRTHDAAARGGRANERARGRDGTRGRRAADGRTSAAARGRRYATPPQVPQPTAPAEAPARVDALDGLRALAIVSVVLYHLGVAWLPSGHLGVVMFLVLTGFLVTTSTRRALERGGAGGLLGLWRRRLVRIWPPMAAMVVAVIALCTLFNHILLTKMRPDIIPSLLLFPNISYIVRGASYFDQIGGPSPLTHLWYLGVDAQFCLVWPALLALAGSGERSASLPRALALALAAASAVLMAVLYDPSADPTRVYYGTDTRAFAPLLGAWLALAWPMGDEPADTPLAALLQDERAPQLAGALSLLALVAMMALLPGMSPVLFRGGMALAAILVTVLLAALRMPGPLATAFSVAPLRWLASRSYALYLWHYPLFALFAVTNSATAWWAVALAVLLSALCAELTVRATAGVTDPATVSRMASPLTLAPIGVVALVAAIGLAAVPETVAAPEDAIESTGAAAGEGMDLATIEAHTPDDASAADDAPADTPAQDLDNLPSGSIVLTESQAEKAAGVYDPVMIGDSVPGASQDYFYAHCPDGLLDAYVGRRPDQMEAVLNDYLEQGIVGNVVILQAFANTTPTDEQLARMVTACGPERSVYLVNVRIPENVMYDMNDAIARAVDRFGNATLIDWNALSAEHMDLLYDDGTHLRPEGIPVYIDMVTNAIKRSFAEGGGLVTGEDGSTALIGDDATGDAAPDDVNATGDAATDADDANV